jgi:hypothetical protein
MSIEAMTLVLNHSRATGRAKLVLIGIANHQGDQGAWPSIETLARYANSSERSVMRDIQDLEALGELIVERNAAPIRGQYRPNLYWVTVKQPGVTDFAPGVTDSTSGVTDQVVRGDTVVTLNLNNPKENHKETIGQIFDEFWQVYPLKQGKGLAKRSFEKALTVAHPNVIIEGARRYRDDPNRSPSFTKHPSTWLNAESWDDDPLPVRVLSPEERAAKDEADRQARWARESQEREQSRLAREAEEQRLRLEREANPVEFCEHGRVAIICNKCPKQQLN